MDRYYQTFTDAIEQNEKNEEKWLKWKNELIETRKNLNEYVKSYSFDIMVPLGKKAFVKGQLQHTNELTVCHGTTGIFSDVSTTQALDILDHRIKICDTNLEAIKNEKKLFKHKIDLPEDAFAKEGQEIIEECSDEKYAEWKVQHAESVRKSKQEEAAKRRNGKTCEIDSDVNELLDKFEIIEELSEELSQMNIEEKDDETLYKLISGEIKVPDSKMRIAGNQALSATSKDTPKCSQDENSNIHISNHLPNESQKLQLCDNNNNDLITKNNQEIVNLLKVYRGKIRDVLKNMRKDDEGSLNLYLDLIELKEEIDDDIRKMNDDEEDESEEDEEISDSDDLTTTQSVDDESQPKKRKVTFSQSLEDVKLIEPIMNGMFNDSGSSTETIESNNTIDIEFQHSEKVFEEFSDPEIVSHPGDIKSKFPHCFKPSFTVKSILKSKKVETPLVNNNHHEVVTKIYQSDIPVIGDVCEHSQPVQDDNVVIVAAKDEAPKKVSKFRQMRRLKS